MRAFLVHWFAKTLWIGAYSRAEGRFILGNHIPRTAVYYRNAAV